MPIPDYQSLMAPVLHELADGEPRPIGHLRDRVAERIGLSPEDREQLVPSGQKPLYRDRISWAVTYLMQAGLLQRPKRAVYAITERGREVLSRHPDRVDNDVLRGFPEFQAFLDRGAPKQPAPGTTAEEQGTPDEALKNAYLRLESAIEADLLEQVKAASPAFFERLVVELLVAIGYGGSREDAGEAIGRSGDEGIDGVIKEDPLGLERILVQAKRWDNRSVGRQDVQAFAGSLEGDRARKGIFMTTSTFSSGARDYVSKIEKRIVLIDGEELAHLMYEHGVGVSTTDTFAVKRVDPDYFSDD